MERYMCSRFFIDFPDVRIQQSKLENYLYNHFHSSEDRLKHEYLMILYQVVDESTVCLMGHERRLTLGLIEEMAYQIYCPPPESTYYHPTPTQQGHHYSHHQVSLRNALVMTKGGHLNLSCTILPSNVVSDTHLAWCVKRNFSMPNLAT